MAYKPVSIDRTSKPPFGVLLRNDGHWSMQGLVGCLALNEQGGNPVLFPNQVFATASGLAWVPNGIHGDGGTDYLRLDAVWTAFPTANSAFTLFAVINPDSNSSTQREVVDIGNGQGSTQWSATAKRGFRMLVNTSNALEGQIMDGTNRYTVSGVKTVSAGSYHAVAYTYVGGGGAQSLYLDGVYENSRTGDSWATSTVASALSEAGGANGLVGDIALICIYNRALSAQEIAALSANPWQIFQPQITWKQTSSIISETLTSTITSLAQAADAQDYIEAATTLIQSGAVAPDVQIMMESVLTLAQSQAALTDIAQLVESCLSTVQSSASIVDALGLVENLASTIQSQTTLTDVLQAVESVQSTIQSAATVADLAQLLESLLTTIQASATVTDTLQSGQTFSETLLTTAISVSQASEAQTFVETVNSVVTSGASLVELAGLVESIGSTVSSISAVSDQQAFVENISIMVSSGASLVEIGIWIDQVRTTAVGTGSVADALWSAFPFKAGNIYRLPTEARMVRLSREERVTILPSETRIFRLPRGIA